MTIPSVLNHYREQEVVSKVKKFYSTFSSAIQLAILENGTVDTWDLAPKSGSFDAASAEKFADYIKPYLNIMTDCGTDSDNECMDDTVYLKLNGNTHLSYGTISNYYKAALADGSTVWWRTSDGGCQGLGQDYANTCAVIWLDINGMTTPNQIGMDTFLLYVLPDRCIFYNGDSCYLDSEGWSCIQHVVEHGNRDYPKSSS